MRDTTTFCTACDEKQRQTDAIWNIEKSILAAEEASDDDTIHIGITRLLNEPFVVKITTSHYYTQKEVDIARYFSKHPHQNIIRHICMFKCKDDAIRWVSKVKAPQSFCTSTGESTVAIFIQEYIEGGDLRDITRAQWTKELWFTMFLQLSYSIIELHSIGFQYIDWHLGNVLLDTTTDNIFEYDVFGKKQQVNTYGYAAILTDFGHARIVPKNEIHFGTLVDSLALICEKLSIAAFGHQESPLKSLYMSLGDAKSPTDITNFINNVTAYIFT